MKKIFIEKEISAFNPTIIFGGWNLEHSNQLVFYSKGYMAIVGLQIRLGPKSPFVCLDNGRNSGKLFSGVLWKGRQLSPKWNFRGRTMHVLWCGRYEQTVCGGRRIEHNLWSGRIWHVKTHVIISNILSTHPRTKELISCFALCAFLWKSRHLALDLSR